MHARNRARSAWQAFWHERPGRRFTARYERHQGQGRRLAGRIVRGAVGVLLVAIGIVFGLLPGPGFVPALAGLALLAGESRGVAAWLDRAELKIREWLR